MERGSFVSETLFWLVTQLNLPDERLAETSGVQADLSQGSFPSVPRDELGPLKNIAWENGYKTTIPV